MGRPSSSMRRSSVWPRARSSAAGSSADEATPGDPDDPVDVQRVAVDPAHRRAGLGRGLFAAADPLLSGRTVLLEVADDNAPALALYAALGFTEIARRPRYYADGRTALVLQGGRR
mgnify:CR=1 FL=1